MKKQIAISDADKKILLHLLNKYLPNTKAWAYGSRVTGKARPASDLDLVVFANREQSLQVGDLREAFEESDLTFRVDLFVWDSVPESFKATIEKEHVVLCDTVNEALQEHVRRYGKAIDMWSETTLGAVTKWLSGGTPPKDCSDYWGGNIPWISANSMHSIYLESSDLTLTSKGLQKGSRLVPKGTVLLLVRGSALHNRIPVGVTRCSVAFNQDVKAIIPQNEALDSGYLLYWLMAKSKYLLDSVVEYTGIGAGKLDTERMCNLPLSLPPITTQNRIANFFRKLDDRIQLLRETNATLEAMGQALFKSWFVDFDPVHAKSEGRTPEGMDAETAALFPAEFEETEQGMIPKGWKVAPIGEHVTIVGGGTPSTKNPDYWAPEEHAWTSPKDLSGLSSPVLLSTEKKISSAGLAVVSSGLLPEGTLLLSSRAPIGYLAITKIPLAINQGYIAVTPDSELPPPFMYFWCKLNMEIIKGHANGSTFMEISKKAFRLIPSIIPDLPVVSACLSILQILFERIASNEEQARTLTALRDTLLPRLISGKLRLPEFTESTSETAV